MPRIPTLMMFVLLSMGQLSSMVALAQTDRAQAARDNSGQMPATKPGTADGAGSPELTGERHPLYRLQPSDVLELNFTFSPEFNQTVTVQPDGFIPLTELEELYVQGMTLPSARERLRALYSNILRDPQISIVLKEFEKPYFVAGGEVARPGKYDLHGETTVVEAVAMAGGFTPQARHSQVVLFRRINQQKFEARLLNVKAMLRSRDLAEDLQLRAGDMLFVPQSTISRIRRFLPASNLGLYWNPGVLK